MKRFALLPAIATLLLAPRLAAAQAAPRLEVAFDHPESYTDIKDRYNETDSGRRSILNELRDSLMLDAKWFLPEGDKLEITFTDIDLAGDFEPWRGAQFDDVRIVKAIYPPAFKFSYKLTDASGRVLKEGQEHIRDINFQDRILIDQNDRLRYEKDILREWMKRTTSDLKKR